MTWYNNSWNYRKPITISNSGSSLTDYQTLVTVDTATLITAGKMRSDCGDTRFTYSDGTTLLNYWIESGPNTSSTKIWVKIPSISNGSNTIYLYYGNAGAASASSTTSTFIREISNVVGAWTLDGNALDTSGNNNSGSIQSANLDDLSDNANHGTKYSANLDDLSGNANHGTIYGATRTSGKIGQALSFNGTSNYVDCGNKFDVAYNAPQTYEIWTKTISTTNIAFLSKSVYASPYTGTIFEIYDGTGIRWQTLTDINLNRLGKIWNVSGFNDGNWHHLVVTKGDNTSANLKLYMDGVEQTTVRTTYNNLSSNVTTSTSFEIGARDGTYQAFNGSMDNICVYNRALSQSEITSHYNNGTGKILDPSTETGLKGYWRGDAVSDVPGKLGNALSFDGIDDYINCGTGSSLDVTTGNFSTEFWIKAATPASNVGILQKALQGSPYTGYVIAANTQGKVSLTFYTINSYPGNSVGVVSSSIVTDNTWKHIVITVVRNGNATIYINGTQDAASNVSSFSASITNNRGLWIGNYNQGSNHYFNGLIDDVRIYNRALSPSEVTAHYNSGNGLISDPATETDLVGYWRMGTTDSMTVPGKFGNALKFDGIDDYVDMGTSASFNATTQFAISLWFKIDTLTAASNLFFRANRSSLYPRGWITTSGTVSFQYRIDGITADVTSTNQVSTGIWYHYVGIIDVISGVKLYINNVEWGTNSNTGTNIDSGISSVRLGLDTNVNMMMNGTIDEVRIYNKALSVAEIADLYNNYGYTTASYPNKELVRKYSSPEPTFSSLGTEQTPTPASITATNMTITPSESPCRIGICTVTIIVRWTNSGDTNGTVTPNITIDTVPQTAHTLKTVFANSYIDETFIISGLAVGTHSICPNPN